MTQGLRFIAISFLATACGEALGATTWTQRIFIGVVLMAGFFPLRPKRKDDDE